MFPNFEFISVLRGGAQKATFHVQSDTEQYCLKVMRPRSRLEERFKREIELLSSLRNHRNIANLEQSNTFIYKGNPISYLCESYIEGQDLKLPTSKNEIWSEEKAANFFAEVCDGLAVLAQNNIIHRDLNPNNIRVKPDGTPVLIDLGVARALDLPSITGARDKSLGTLAYMSPEQIKGSNISFNSDLFAVGIMLHEALTGTHPFFKKGMSADEVESSILSLECLLDEPRYRSLKSPTRCLIGCLLCKDPAKRFQQASEVAVALRELVNPRLPPKLTDVSKQDYWDCLVVFGAFAISSLFALSRKTVTTDDATDDLEKVLAGIQDLYTNSKLLDSRHESRFENRSAIQIVQSLPKLFQMIDDSEVSQLNGAEFFGLFLTIIWWENVQLENISWMRPELVQTALKFGET